MIDEANDGLVLLFARCQPLMDTFNDHEQLCESVVRILDRHLVDAVAKKNYSS